MKPPIGLTVIDIVELGAEDGDPTEPRRRI
jgi:hypothetical protein